jgi:hypothetical protein
MFVDQKIYVKNTKCPALCCLLLVIGPSKMLCEALELENYLLKKIRSHAPENLIKTSWVKFIKI